MQRRTKVDANILARITGSEVEFTCDYVGWLKHSVSECKKNNAVVASPTEHRQEFNPDPKRKVIRFLCLDTSQWIKVKILDSYVQDCVNYWEKLYSMVITQSDCTIRGLFTVVRLNVNVSNMNSRINVSQNLG